MGYELILLGSKKKGMLSMIHVACIFTSDRIVFAHIDNEMQKRVLANKKAQMKAEGKGFFQKGAGMLKAMGEYVDLYHQKNIDDILRENSMNFQIADNTITKIIFKPLSISMSNDPDYGDTKSGGTLVIKTTTDKIKITHRYNDNNRALKKYFKAKFGRIAK